MRAFAILCLVLWSAFAAAQSGPQGGVVGPGTGITGPGAGGGGGGNPPLGPNIPVGAGIGFSWHQAGLFVLPATSLNFSAPWTVSFGLKATSFLPTGNTMFISTNPDTTAGGTGFMLYNAVGAGFTFSGLIRPYNAPTNCTDPPVTCSRGTTLLDNVQHWVTWTFDGTNATLYIDNQLKDTFGPAQGYIPSSSVPWQLGIGGAGITLTDMRVRTVTASASDVASLYAYNSTGKTPSSGVWNTSLAAYWPMSASTIVGNTAQDVSGNHNDAKFDVTPPVVVVTAPVGGAVLTGSATLTATCTDDLFVTSVTLLVDGFPAAVVTTSPYTTSFDSTRLLDGSHTIGATCVDPSGNIGTAATVAVTSSNGRTGTDYYASQSTGNDANNGTSTGTPWQTTTKINAASFHAGDRLHMAGGDTWTCNTGTECLLIGGPGASGGIPANYDGWPSASFTVDNNFNIGNGTACAPLAGTTTGCWNLDLSGGTVTLGVLMSNVSGVTLTKGKVLGGSFQLGTFQAAFGVYLRPTGIVSMYNNTVTAMNVQDMSVGIFTVSGGVPPSSVGPTITNNWIHGSTSSTTMDAGILLQGSLSSQSSPGLIQGNLVENIGARTAGGFAGASGNPILISNGSTWYTDQMNVTRNSGVNNLLCGGPAGNWTFNGFNLTFKFNESYGMTWTTGCDGDGFDIDGGSQNILYEYNYAHGNKGQGFLTFMASANGAAWQNNTIRYGISENDDSGCPDTTCGAVELTAGVGSTGASWVYNLTVWNGINVNGTSRSSAMSIQTGCPGPGSYIANNLFASVMDHFGTVLHANLNSLSGGCANTLWKANAWYAATGTTLLWQRVGAAGNASNLSGWQTIVPGGDTGANTSNPNFVGTGGAGGTCYSSGIPGGPQPCPSPYSLNSGSPDRSAGIDLTQAPYSLTVGTSDYYAHSIPGTGPCYNIGAYGVCP